MTATNLAEAKKQGAVLAWGNFVTIAINFAIVAGALFFVVKGINFAPQSCSAEEEKAAAETPPRQEILLEEIRDLLRRSNGMTSRDELSRMPSVDLIAGLRGRAREAPESGIVEAS